MKALPSSPGDTATRRLMTVLFIGVFMSALDTAIIAPAIPAIRSAFGIDNRQVGLVMIVFVMFSLASTALMANLGDRHGRRPVYLVSVALFALGSLVIALAPAFWVILLGRAIQGVGGGGIIPTASAVIADAFPPERRGKALGMIGATYGMAFVLGPPTAGLVMLVASWQWIFLANLPIAAAVLALGARALPRQQKSDVQAPLDVAGIVVVFALLGSLVMGVTRVADGLTGQLLWPWFLLAVAVLLPVLVAVERKAGRPMIPLSLFGSQQLTTAYLLTTGAGFGMGSVAFMTSIAHLAYGVTAQRTGFALLPLVVCSMLGSMGSGRLLNRLGARSLIFAGFLLMAAGYAGSAVTAFGLWGFILASMPVGLGVGVAVGGALRSVAIDEAPQALRGAAQGLINICTSIGTLLSAAAIGAMADFGGGGVGGFAVAYLAVGALMLAMMFGTLALRDDRGLAAAVRAAH
jgi:MFS family permease